VQQFTRTFLGLRERWRLGDRISLAIIAFYVLLGVAATAFIQHFDAHRFGIGIHQHQLGRRSA
jgi:hypothetical protein